MKNTLETKIIILIIIASLILISCQGEFPGKPTFYIIGSLVKNDGTSPDTHKGFVKLLVLDSTNDAVPLYQSAPGTFLGNSTQFLISSILPGSYTLSAFIDMNDNAPEASTNEPDTGDFYIRGNITIMYNIGLTISDPWSTK